MSCRDRARRTICDNDIFNSAFLFNPDGQFVKVYHKRKLVHLRRIIVVRWPPFLKWFTPITGGYEAGIFPATV